MKYRSTRGESPAVSAASAIVAGLAPDGGLYLPEKLPRLSARELAKLGTLGYRETAVLILRKYLDFSAPKLRRMVREAYASFETAEPAVLAPVDGTLTALELWHGPSCAFKDMALQLLPRLLTASLRREGIRDRIHILTATSGDTGKAALEGFRDVPGTEITVFYPDEGVSEVQKAQMVRQEGGNVRVTAVAGNFDDAQSAVKRIFSDRELGARLRREGVRLSSANSINWGRLLPQIVYYVYAAARVSAENGGRPVSFLVPTGNFGDILAGYLAKRMGAPVGRLVCASNQNRVLTDFFETGVYDRNRPFYKTGSPSMDILISSNLERLLFLASDGDAALVRRLMRELGETGRYEVPAELLARLREDFAAASADEAETAAAIAALWRKGYLADPHTAVGYAALGAAPADEPLVLVSTASPFKFAGTVLRALDGGSADVPEGFGALDALAARCGRPVPPPLARLRSLPVRFTETLPPEELGGLF